MSNNNSKKILGVYTLTMINVAAILSLRNLPVMAELGWASIFFYLLSGIVFFIPSALVSAELATGWATTGGVYTWVKAAYGKKWGFVAIWMQWVENLFWYPAVLSFTGATIAYLIDPSLAENKYYILTVIFLLYWACTFVNYFGMELSGLLSSTGVMLGTLIPGAFLILLGLLWVISGHPLEIPFSKEALIPDMSSVQNVVFLVGVMLGFAGMEMSAVHAREVENPQRDYPRAIFFATIIILVLSVLGSLAIAFVVPQSEISLVAGIMQAMKALLARFGLSWMMPIFAVMISFGAISMVSTWIIGPSKGLFQTAHEGLLPPLFHKRNRFGMPSSILIGQGIVVSLFSLAFLFMPTVSSSYWILTDLTAMLYLIMYILMFMAAIRLRYTHPEVERAYRIPGGKNWGMWCVAGTGLIASIASVIIGFVPPAQLDTGDLLTFELFLGIGMVVMTAIPLVIYMLHRKEWELAVEEETNV